MPTATALNQEINANEIAKLLSSNYSKLIAEFYQMQSNFLSSRYKINKSIETSNILTYLAMDLHLSIIRKRENNLNYDISFNNFFYNNENTIEHGQKISTISKYTGLPKETVRRKLIKLIESETVAYNKENKKFFWILKKKNYSLFSDFMSKDINSIAKFVLCITSCLNLNLKLKYIENEIKSNFSFTYYHFYSCQMEWIKMWQNKLSDVDLLFIAIQALIPTLKYQEMKLSADINEHNLYSVIGKTNDGYKKSNNSISATSISEISGIPRATCIRKLNKLVKLGLLIREINTKRYYVNPIQAERTKYITKKEYVLNTVNYFSEFLSVIIKSLARNKINQ